MRFSHAVTDVGNIRKAFGRFSESIHTLSKITKRLQIFVLRGLEGMYIKPIQLFRERLWDKVHATTPKGIVVGFECTVFQRNLKE